eukprot:3045532-Prymnesium_polylepis.1
MRAHNRGRCVTRRSNAPWLSAANSVCKKDGIFLIDRSALGHSTWCPPDGTRSNGELMHKGGEVGEAEAGKAWG